MTCSRRLPVRASFYIALFLVVGSACHPQDLQYRAHVVGSWDWREDPKQIDGTTTLVLETEEAPGEWRVACSAEYVMNSANYDLLPCSDCDYSFTTGHTLGAGRHWLCRRAIGDAGWNAGPPVPPLAFYEDYRDASFWWDVYPGHLASPHTSHVTGETFWNYWYYASFEEASGEIIWQTHLTYDGLPNLELFDWL